MPTPIPEIDDLVDLPSIADPATFEVRADSLLTEQLPTLITQMNATTAAVEVVGGECEDARDAAIAAATASMLGTSASSVAIGTGSKGFTTQAGKNWGEGSWLMIASDADPTNFMFGYVTAYSGTALTVTVTKIGGAGTHTDWNISLSGPGGEDGDNGTAGADGSGPWVQIGSTVNTTSGSSVTIATIPPGHDDLYLEFVGVSHDAGDDASTGAQFRVELSDNGSNWTTPARCSNATVLKSETVYGGLFFPRYLAAGGMWVGNVSARSANRTGGIGDFVSGSERIDAGIAYIRISTSTGSLDGGSVKLWGRTPPA